MAKTILTPLQKQVLSLLSHDQVIQTSFYLSGGTALAEYYLHHRLSDDLDFFTHLEIIDTLWLAKLAKLIQVKTKAKKFDMQQSFNRNLLFFEYPDTILKTEFTSYPFEQIETTSKHEGFSVDSLRDIATNKFFTIYQQPSTRHFIDLYCILNTKKIYWDELEKLARMKFDTYIEPIQLGTQLMQVKNIIGRPQLIIDLPDATWQSFFLKKALLLKEKIVNE